MSQIKFYRINISTYIALKYYLIVMGSYFFLLAMPQAGLASAMMVKIVLPCYAATVKGHHNNDSKQRCQQVLC
jgi:hypothetical protein